MIIENLTPHVYRLPGLTLHGDTTETVNDTHYLNDEAFRGELHALVAHGKVRVSSAPDGYPIQTGAEREAAESPFSGAPQWIIRTLLAAEILDLVANPVEIVPAPGAGNILLPLSGWLHYRPGAVPFDGSANSLGLAYNTTPGNEAATGVWSTGELQGGGFTATDWLTATEPMFGFFNTSLQLSYFVAADSTNVPLVFCNFTPFDLLEGDGTLTVSVLYSVLAVDSG